ncbi:DUF5063 domain-containing protein [Ornithinicoccus halotolerans]|uniref:DUF5063 domain-containing protein n=1 Tax=Ornithinicoccus halotolerans TaxID=1748220 RepID=UPI001294F030|nr:DUF5063 domain-containing protein [Ornithinicoccus halotolerans]
MEDLSHDTATEVRAFLTAIREVAAGNDPGTALPVLLLALAQVQSAGARLGAVVDVVPRERFEPDAGPDPDLDAVRTGLRSLLAGLDDYADLADPIVSGEVVRGSLTDDLATIAADLQHGLDHYQQGRAIEALWWWQFSYLSSWGERSAAAVRVLHGLLAHVRLDVDAETAMEAELAALHAPARDEE